jgi:hypothetical protein
MNLFDLLSRDTTLHKSPALTAGVCGTVSAVWGVIGFVWPHAGTQVLVLPWAGAIP